MIIDWSKAPEGATHFYAAENRTCSFMKLEGDTWFFWPPASNAPEWTFWRRDHSVLDADMIPAPAPWSGEGLPPVGTVCEVEDPHTSDEWCECTILAWDAECAVFKADGNYPYVYDGQGIGCFRPIRTPEQIAADARLHEIRNALTTIKAGQPFPNDLVRGNITVSVVEAMIDAGYRKQEAP